AHRHRRGPVPVGPLHQADRQPERHRGREDRHGHLRLGRAERGDPAGRPGGVPARDPGLPADGRPPGRAAARGPDGGHPPRADPAEHVASVIAPALARGAVVITDRYVDSSLAYQGAGRNLAVDEIARFNRWATGGRTPDLTILLDMDPMAGLSRRARSADRLE